VLAKIVLIYPAVSRTCTKAIGFGAIPCINRDDMKKTDAHRKADSDAVADLGYLEEVD